MRPYKPTLAQLFQQLRHSAQASGEDRAMDLAKGARIAVRVRDGQITLSIARRGARVGDTEEITFSANCGVPPGATRRPAEGQQQLAWAGEMYWRIVYQWSAVNE